MIQRAAAIVIKDGKILLIHRKKEGKDYYAIPGGHVEAGESLETAAIRELKEETNLDAEVEDLFMESKDAGWHNHFFRVKNIRGETCLGGEELERNCQENNYELLWIETTKLSEINLLPLEIKEKILEKYC